VWYQGESSALEAPSYRTLLTGLMADWRSSFGADLPFLIVQLANYGPATTRPTDGAWAELREAQRLTVGADPHAALAAAIDLGERSDIHPANKQELGRRLARAARHVVYGETLAPTGPVPISARRDGGRIVVTFGDVAGDLLVYGGNRPVGFELCGKDPASCQFVDATVEKNRVWLEPGSAQAVIRVRYSWADCPVSNLYDRAGLPAGPFEIAIE
jgi:sialate O-acetylesterase